MRRKKQDLITIGWREWVTLPLIEHAAIKAKVDTGARSSALHAYDVETERLDDGRRMVHFKVHPVQRESQTVVEASAELLEERWVTSSTGRRTLRPVIVTPVTLMGMQWPIELTLVNRDAMGFRMLLGREALRKRFVVDPGHSFVGGKPASSRSAKRTKRKRVGKKRKSNKD